MENGVKVSSSYTASKAPSSSFLSSSTIVEGLLEDVEDDSKNELIKSDAKCGTLNVVQSNVLMWKHFK